MKERRFRLPFFSKKDRPSNRLMTADVQIYSPDSLINIGDRKGSNPGGFYKDTKTGEEFYIKFYSNTDQAACEFLANTIYKSLNIPVPISSLVSLNDRVGVALLKIEVSNQTAHEELSRNRQFLEGFLADAFLGNYDVAGVNSDNVMVDVSGRLVRIDNGGVLFFRATSGRKQVGTKYEYKKDSVPEIDNFRRDKELSAGKVYSNAEITDEMLFEQAMRLVETLRPKVIKGFVVRSGYSDYKEMHTYLLGRIRYIKRRFNISGERKKARSVTSLI